MRKKIVALLLIISAVSSSLAMAEENVVSTDAEVKVVDSDAEVKVVVEQNQTISFYVVTHSQTGHDYWAVSQDGSRGLWFKESDLTGELLKENDTFKATLDENGKIVSIEKYVLE